MRLSTEPNGDLQVVQVTLPGDEDSGVRDELLTDGITAVIAALTQATGVASRGVVVDIRVPQTGRHDRASAHREGFIAACHGLVHSYVAERRSEIVPVNVLVTAAGQDDDRQATLAYLGSEDGEFARGSFFDLRSRS
jgi:hypothetical protein